MLKPVRNTSKARYAGWICAMFMFVGPGCDGGTKAPDRPSEGKGEVASPATPESASPRKDVKVVDGSPAGDERYTVQIEVSDAAVGEESKVSVRVLPRAPWHMNLDYPASLEVDAPQGIELAKGNLKKSDATRLDEDSLVFDVAFTANETGDKTMTGQFKFAVCQDDACAPVTESVEMKVAVK